MILIQRLKIEISRFCAKLDIWPSHVLCVTRINVGRVVAGAGAGANPSSRTFLAESEVTNFGRRRRPESEVTNFLAESEVTDFRCRWRPESELANFPAPIRGHGLLAPAVPIRACEWNFLAVGRRGASK